jgi:misacylated tRNA(Ala) deacylase
MPLPATTRLYLQDEYCFESAASLLWIHQDALALDRTCFYPGGGGQPPDEGEIQLEDGTVMEISSAFSDAEGVIWHVSRTQPPSAVPGQPVRFVINMVRRLALMRYHTVLHVLNTIALRDYDAWITGVQIGVDQSRIDFKLENFSPVLMAELETKVNAVLLEDHPVKSYYLTEEEFRGRPDLLRTLQVKPPGVDGRVRVVEIEGFDAQACGGTHVHSTAEVGRFSIFRTENKGKLNKRLYVRLAETRE